MSAEPLAIDTHVLREYALLADGERGALIGPRGDISWMCLPGWADPAVFAGLIGGRGHYTVTPVGRFVWGGSYEPGSLIWVSRWILDQGATVESREALVFPGDRERAVLLRRLRTVTGEADVQVELEPAHDYGRRQATRMKRDDDGRWTAALGDQRMLWTGLPEAEPADHGILRAQLHLRAGETRDLVLVLGRDPRPVNADEAWSATTAAWEEAIPELEVAIAHRDARHSCAVLRGLTSRGGGMVAAATTSLPERARQNRSYDYRYAWVRDQAFAGEAAARAGVPSLLEDAVHFLGERLLDDGPNLRPAYTVDGGPLPGEFKLDLSGYPGGTDVIGNHAGAQFQLDAFGESLLMFAAADRAERLNADGWEAVRVAVRAIAERYTEPDAGIWELEERIWTHSRLICAAGLRAVAARPTAGSTSGDWLALADKLTASVGGAITADGRWQRALDDPRPDGALLFAGIRGATLPNDPRALATIASVEQDLSEDFFAYRFRPDGRPLGEAEGAFLLCGFAMALALHACGREREAAHWFERNRSACGTPGLLSEEWDVRQRQLRGNLPQAFVHALLLESAAALSEESSERPNPQGGTPR